MRVVWDIETYPNVFTFAAEFADLDVTINFEISDYKNQFNSLRDFIQLLALNGHEMVGFNSLAFDYPVLHFIMKMNGHATPAMIYEKAMSIIEAQDGDRFAHMVYPSDRIVPQIDLLKIWHFDNKARMTSLKALEFAMRSESIEDLPFPVGTRLTVDQVSVLRRYNATDVRETKKFYMKSLEHIQFRESLTKKYGRDFMNHSDVKIGAEIFQMSLEAAGVQCYEYGTSGRQPRQTRRPVIRLRECIPSWVRFNTPEFQRIHQYLMAQEITETKGVFKDLVAHYAGIDFVFGTGGIHASVENRQYVAGNGKMILDLDVTSMYPSIAISQGYYPEHLGPKFVEIYEKLRVERVGHKKGTPENAMLKLALNGVYGKSNDQFSIFFDPKFTMSVTLTGQLALAMLAETVSSCAEIIQCNTDGITLFAPEQHYDAIMSLVAEWQKITGMMMEEVRYSKMIIADVNNYIAKDLTGNVKRKGRYEYDVEWHQDASALVVPKIAEKVLLEGASIWETLTNWHDLADFMIRVKVPRSSYLTANGERIQNTTRYYVTPSGKTLVKHMPPLKGKTDWRRFNIESGWQVCVCNRLSDATLPVNFNYYRNEIEKLTLGIQ